MPFGEGLMRPVPAMLDALDWVPGHRTDFDPSTSTRTFRIGMTEVGCAL